MEPEFMLRDPWDADAVYVQIGSCQVTPPFKGGIPETFPEKYEYDPEWDGEMNIVAMTPCVCPNDWTWYACGYAADQNEFRDDHFLPTETLAAIGLTEADVRPMLTDVPAALLGGAFVKVFFSPALGHKNAHFAHAHTFCGSEGVRFAEPSSPPSRG